MTNYRHCQILLQLLLLLASRIILAQTADDHTTCRVLRRDSLCIQGQSCVEESYICENDNLFYDLNLTTSQEVQLQHQLHQSLAVGSTTLLLLSYNESTDVDANARVLTIPPTTNLTLTLSSSSRRRQREQRRQLTNTNLNGDFYFLVVKVIDSNGLAIADDALEMSDNWFGNGRDPIHAKSQLHDCSGGAFNATPGYNPDTVSTATQNAYDAAATAPGVVSVTLPVALTAASSTRTVVASQALYAVSSLLHIPPAEFPGPFHHVALVLEDCYHDCGWGSWANVGSYLSVYAGSYYKGAHTQLFSLGLNFGFDHSGVSGSFDPISDGTCTMGIGLLPDGDDAGLNCYNPAKSYFSNWYQTESIDPLVSSNNGDWNGLIMGAGDWLDYPNAYPVAVRIEINNFIEFNHYFVGFNAAVGANAETAEAINAVTVTTALGDRIGYGSASTRQFVGYSCDTFTIANFAGSGQDLCIHVHSIDTSSSPGLANVTIGFGCPVCETNFEVRLEAEGSLTASAASLTNETKTKEVIASAIENTVEYLDQNATVPYVNLTYPNTTTNNDRRRLSSSSTTSYTINFTAPVVLSGSCTTGCNDTIENITIDATVSLTNNTIVQENLQQEAVIANDTFVAESNLDYIIVGDTEVTQSLPTAEPTVAPTAAPTAAPTTASPTIKTPPPTASPTLIWNGGANGDPIILGLQQQVFKFEGRDGAWYSNVSNKYLQWNLQFRRFDDCPADENMLIAGMTLTTMDEINTVSNLLIVTTPEPTKECREDPNVICLGDGTLHLSFDGGATFASASGDYQYGSRNRVVAHNTYAACSRKWHDYDVTSSQRDRRSLRDGGRRTTIQQTKPLQLLADHTARMIDPEECHDWIQERFVRNDLFQQRGLWSTLYVETPLVTFHIEYRRSDHLLQKKNRNSCNFQSLDAWMTRIDERMDQLPQWQGILGETKQRIFYEHNGKQIKSDRYRLLKGHYDADYEVSDPFGTDFAALNIKPNKKRRRSIVSKS